MRFLILLFLSIPTFAQKNLIIFDENRVPILGASVFLIAEKNKLVGVSDERGSVSLVLKPDAKYLVHSLGFVDSAFNAEQFEKQNTIFLRASTYRLNQVVTSGILSTFVIKQPIFKKTYRTISDFPQDANIQRVNLIKIDSGGYLKSFKLFCKVYVKEVTPDYRFLLYLEKDGKPDRLILPLKIDGKRTKKEIVFELKETNYYLEAGNYFIGYETFNGKSIIKKQVFNDKKHGQFITIPIVILASGEEKISYFRQNLTNWSIPKMGNLVNGKMVWEDNLSQNFAYELQMLY